MISIRLTRLAVPLALAAVALLSHAAPAGAAFGFQPGPTGFSFAATNQDESADSLAGSHPYQLTSGFAFNETSDSTGEPIPDGDLRDLTLATPPGLIGNAVGIPQCTSAQFTTPDPNKAFGLAGESCPASSQIGTAAVYISFGGPPTPLTVGLYNLVPPPGTPAEFGFNAIGLVSSRLAPRLAPRAEAGGYGITVEALHTSQLQRIYGVTTTFWGVPAESSHDGERGACLSLFGGSTGSECPTDAGPKAFLRMPTSCGSPLPATASADSWQQPGVFAQASSEGPPLERCDRPHFAPELDLRPLSSAADSPTGLHLQFHLPSRETPASTAAADLKDARVTLPPGLLVNPASAADLQSCAPAQIELHGPEPASCPAASKIGSLSVDTPLLDHPLPGAVYLAEQGENPFGSLLAIYLVVEDPQTGVIVKLAGRAEPDPQTGQLTTTFSENPQLPFEDLQLDLFGGPRAPLRTPSTCGAFATTSDLTPWSSPSGADARPSSSFEITSGPGGAPCSTSEAAQPNAPSFEAGTTTPIAGSYSPLVLKLAREDGSQQISSIDTTLPPGLSGRLAGIPYCSEAALAAASTKTGKAERESPSCPLASEVGTVKVGAGSGPDPLYVQGHAYLAGPYRGAPLSLAIITPALAGPFDLGTVVVRTALYINETTAQIHAVSDPLPRILAGIPLDLRSIALNMDRTNFTLNPTSCDPMAVLGSATSTLGQAAALSNRFQVGACGALAFKPKLAISLTGATRRTGHPALKAVLTYPHTGAYANIARAQVTLPRNAFLDQSHIGTVCTRVQFAAGGGNGEQCPAASVYGHARALTPLLDKPLEGPVYLRSSSHDLPDLVAALSGQIDVALDGRVDTGRGGGLRNTFEAVPDTPVSKFVLEMHGGKRGLLINSENICSHPQKAFGHFVAQNGKVDNITPVIANSCKQKSHKKKHRSAHR